MGLIGNKAMAKSSQKSKQKVINIHPSVYYGNTIVVHIDGTPGGLRYLANMLIKLADHDQENDTNLPTGEREHIHLSPDSILGDHSCQVEICRADAKGTGELIKYSS
jgi:hypothetical protein